jgi:hypothetical protein
MADDVAPALSRVSSPTGRSLPERVALVERDVVDHADQLSVLFRAQRDQAADLADIKAWRHGLLAEIRGALRVPKVILASTPIAMLALAIWTAVQR